MYFERHTLRVAFCPGLHTDELCEQLKDCERPPLQCGVWLVVPHGQFLPYVWSCCSSNIISFLFVCLCVGSISQYRAKQKPCTSFPLHQPPQCWFSWFNTPPTHTFFYLPGVVGQGHSWSFFLLMAFRCRPVFCGQSCWLDFCWGGGRKWWEVEK